MRKSASCWSLSPAAPDLRCWASRWGFEPSPPSIFSPPCRLCTTCIHYWQVFQAQQKGVSRLNGLVMKILRLITALKMIIFKLGGDKTEPVWWGLISTSTVVIEFMTFLCWRTPVCVGLVGDPGWTNIAIQNSVAGWTFERLPSVWHGRKQQFPVKWTHKETVSLYF